MTDMQKAVKKLLSKKVSSTKQKIKRRENNIASMQHEIASLSPMLNKEVWEDLAKITCLNILKDKMMCTAYAQCYSCVFMGSSCLLQNRKRINMQNVIAALGLFISDKEIKDLTLEHLL